MDEMEVEYEPFLLNLPTEIVEKIFLYLPLADRKSLRLTCKWFYELCNTDRFCSEENVIWCEDMINYANVESDLFRIGRSYYNLVMYDQTVAKSSILPFFEKLGAKVRSIEITECKLQRGSLESILQLCEGLCSLHLSSFPLETSFLHPPSDYFTIEPFSIIRPNVTYLKLSLPPSKPYDYFRRIFSIFPNVEDLHIELSTFEIHETNYLEKLAEECSAIFDDIVRLGSSLEDLELDIPLSQSTTNKNFFEAFPNLEKLKVHFDRRILSVTEKWYPCGSNLRSVRLGSLLIFRPPDMIRLMTNTRLKYLKIESDRINFTEESFKKLVNSRLSIVKFDVNEIVSDPPVTNRDIQVKANKTVRDLYLLNEEGYDPIETLFPKYFRGLIHLTVHLVTDSILQNIFQYQRNLRSLYLKQCVNCSINGFWGSKDDGSEYSINNLQKLEHLTIIGIPSEVIKSDGFKRAFKLSRLKYLCIGSTGERSVTPACAEIPTVLYEKLTRLRALRLGDIAMPHHETLSSLFKSLKHLNYLRCDLSHSEDNSRYAVAFINVNHKDCSVSDKEYQDAFSCGHAFYQKGSDRLVVLNEALKRILYCPKISTFEVDWIVS